VPATKGAQYSSEPRNLQGVLTIFQSFIEISAYKTGLFRTPSTIIPRCTLIRTEATTQFQQAITNATIGEAEFEGTFIQHISIEGPVHHGLADAVDVIAPTLAVNCCHRG